jgi:hypothetical protein
MTKRRKPNALAPRISSTTDVTGQAIPNHLANLDVSRLKLFFELQEKQKQQDFEHEMELRRQGQHEMERENSSTHSLAVQRLELYFKMFVTAAALIVGTTFVLTSHEQVGYFMLGGALSTITSGVVSLMKASR